MKLMLAILLVVGGAAIGFAKASVLQRRVKELAAFTELVEWLSRNLQFRRLSTEALLQTAAGDARFAACEPLRYCVEHWDGQQSFLEAWKQAVAQSGSHLLPQETVLVQMLGEILGVGAAAEQREALESLSGMMTLQRRDAEEQVKQDGGLCRTLGIFGGLFAAVLIL